ncbi:MAG: RNA methyltransferase [Eggerthellaceae bacterium]|nr:RNA methyltransferase [Eggerthellaceae bacterium]
MDIVEIASLDDERVAAFSRLTEAQLRNRIEPEQGVFIAESPKVIQRALDAGMVALSFLMERDKLELARPLVAQACAQQNAASLPVYTGESEVLALLTGFELTRGVLCAMRRPALPDVQNLLATCRDGGIARRVAVLEGIVDHTNVGALFRSAAALGIDAVLVTPTCCDPLYRRCVRVSMGTVFQVPWTRIGSSLADWPEAGLALLSREGFRTVALALSDDAHSIDAPELAAEDRLALVLGTEGDGLAASTIASCDYVAKIPMREGVDSLNVAAASAVAFWQLRV